MHKVSYGSSHHRYSSWLNGRGARWLACLPAETKTTDFSLMSLTHLEYHYTNKWTCQATAWWSPQDIFLGRGFFSEQKYSSQFECQGTTLWIYSRAIPSHQMTANLDVDSNMESSESTCMIGMPDFGNKINHGHPRISHNRIYMPRIVFSSCNDLPTFLWARHTSFGVSYATGHYSWTSFSCVQFFGNLLKGMPLPWKGYVYDLDYAYCRHFRFKSLCFHTVLLIPHL